MLENRLGKVTGFPVAAQAPVLIELGVERAAATLLALVPFLATV